MANDRQSILLDVNVCAYHCVSNARIFIYPIDLNKSNSAELSCYPAVIDVSIRSCLNRCGHCKRSPRNSGDDTECNVKPKTAQIVHTVCYKHIRLDCFESLQFSYFTMFTMNVLRRQRHTGPNNNGLQFTIHIDGSVGPNEAAQLASAQCMLEMGAHKSVK